MSNYDYDVVVLGSGPGGYVAAIRASQLGLKTAIVERENLGGVCLNWGCIPTKALIHNAEVLETLHDAESLGFTFENLKVDYAAAVKRSRDISGRQAKGVGFLMRKNKIEVIEGHGVFTDPHTLQISPTEYFPESKERTVTAANVIIAVGARARGLPGVEIDGDRIIQYRDAIVMDKLPKKLIVVGSGAIGMEFSYIYNAYGVEVTVIEMLDQVLPLEDAEVAAEVAKAVRKAGINVLVSTRTEGAEKTKKGVKVTVKNLKDDSTETLEADKVLMAAGVQPNTDKAGLDAAGVQLSERGGYVEIDEVMRTNVPHIYAIGDVARAPLLAHKAMKEGLAAAEHAAGKPTAYDTVVPSVIYTDPELASVGMTEEEAKAAGYEVRVGRFPLLASGRASTLGVDSGVIKLVGDAKTDLLLGFHMVGPNAGDIVSEAALAIEMGATLEDIALTQHPHPTISEGVMEAAEHAHGRAIHIANRRR